MADVKISGLSAASALADADLLEVVQSGTNYKATASQVRTYVGGAAFSAITSTTTSGSISSVVFTSLNVEDLIIYAETVSIASGTGDLQVEFSTNNGSTYISGAMPLASSTLDTTPRRGAFLLTGLKIGLVNKSLAATSALNSGSSPLRFNVSGGQGAVVIAGAQINAIRVSASTSNFVDNSVISIKGRG